MKQFVIKATLASALCWIMFVFLYKWTNYRVLNTIAISFGVTFYHFFMRMMIGALFGAGIGPHLEFKSTWFIERSFEKKLYKALKVKSWKKIVPTYDSSSYDFNKLSLEQIYKSTCLSELVHDVIIIFSFIPILFSIYVGKIEVFIFTSVLAAIFDLIFVVVQRYNRPRILKLINITRTK